LARGRIYLPRIWCQEGEGVRWHFCHLENYAKNLFFPPNRALGIAIAVQILLTFCSLSVELPKSNPLSTLPQTFGALKRSPFAAPDRIHQTVKDEMRRNLLARLAKRRRLPSQGGHSPEEDPIFPGILGYEDTVMPQIINAILSRHNFILLGLRGQAKSRILRALTTLLDDVIPIVAGSEINDNPFAPISKYAKTLLAEKGDDTPITWVGRENRYIEKLATPDVTIADLIGDVDPIKAARGGHLLSDELTIHYGMLPRSNRGIFALNELPDLAGKVQVGLFNIMQEGDVQIKGYPIRLPLDVMLVFSANPEDYTARGKIITPLKDRIGSEILTHYPENIEIGMSITRQEAWIERETMPVRIPDFIEELIERVAFEARTDKRIDKRSGVSQRLPITLMENVISNAERRALMVGESEIVPRIADVYAALPAITGKIELEYEGELIGGHVIARELIRRAADATLKSRAEAMNTDEIVIWFDEGGALQVTDDAPAETVIKGFTTVPGLIDLVHVFHLAQPDDTPMTAAAGELILEALVARRKISRSDEGGYGRATNDRRYRSDQGYFDGLSA
jgi:magnesium chelatase subunit I